MNSYFATVHMPPPTNDADPDNRINPASRPMSLVRRGNLQRRNLHGFRLGTDFDVRTLDIVFRHLPRSRLYLDLRKFGLFRLADLAS
jgi:hypothetical protein